MLNTLRLYEVHYVWAPLSVYEYTGKRREKNSKLPDWSIERANLKKFASNEFEWLWDEAFLVRDKQNQTHWKMNNWIIIEVIYPIDIALIAFTRGQNYSHFFTVETVARTRMVIVSYDRPVYI